MPRQLLMTYVPSQKRWTKHYRGTTYSVSCRQLGTAPSKEASWLAANNWWETKQAEVDAKDSAERETPEALAEGRITAALDAADTVQLRELIQRHLADMLRATR